MDTHNRRRLARLWLGLLLVLIPIPVHAAPVPVASDPVVVRSLSNASMELVFNYDSTVRPARFQIYLSDFATNAPVSGAQITLRTTTPATSSTTATPVRAGVYEAILAYPQAGDYTLLVTVSGPVTGEFALTKQPMGRTPGGTGPTPGTAISRRPVLLLLVLGLALTAIALWVVVRRRRAQASVRRAQSAALILTAALSLGHSVAIAHEGHSNLPAIAAGATGPRYVAKESQFLLGIRTLPLRLESLRSQLSAVGHVVPGAGAWTTIAAPQSGRFDGAGRALAVGDRVRRGQLLGYLQVIDRLPIRAPISGLIAEVEATSGQWVQAGQPLVRVLDPDHLRVEVPLFGENLSRGLMTRTATVRLSAAPDRSFPARVLGLAPTAGGQFAAEGERATGPAPAAALPPLLLDVSNIGGLLRPGMLVEASLETALSESVLAVPPSAVVYQETGPGVFVHTRPEHFEFRAVAVGARFVNRIGVSGNLKPGDRVVTQGAYSLVAVPSGSPAAGAGQR